jgi:hypothetical protein
MTTRWHRHPFFVLGAFTLLLHQACFSVRPWRTQYRPWDPKVIARADRVRVEMVDKSVLELVDVTLEEGPQGSQLRGTLVDDKGHSLGAAVLPAFRVSQLETRRIEALRVIAWVGLAVVGAFVVLIVGALCALGGCDDPGVTITLGLYQRPQGVPRALVPARWLAAPPSCGRA